MFNLKDLSCVRLRGVVNPEKESVLHAGLRMIDGDSASLESNWRDDLSIKTVGWTRFQIVRDGLKNPQHEVRMQVPSSNALDDRFRYINLEFLG